MKAWRRQSARAKSTRRESRGRLLPGFHRAITAVRLRTSPHRLSHTPPCMLAGIAACNFSGAFEPPCRPLVAGGLRAARQWSRSHLPGLHPAHTGAIVASADNGYLSRVEKAAPAGTQCIQRNPFPGSLRLALCCRARFIRFYSAVDLTPWKVVRREEGPQLHWTDDAGACRCFKTFCSHQFRS